MLRLAVRDCLNVALFVNGLTVAVRFSSFEINRVPTDRAEGSWFAVSAHNVHA